jgi:CMP-N,N'-diacetyllegionaminic acid synthase
MRLLFIIPARGGSKGIPGKNIKPLSGKPLIHYSIAYARLFTTDDNICVSTDSEAIANCVMETGLQVPFIRPAALATDTAGSFEVMQHALSFYENRNIGFDAIVLLQPTSPVRLKKHLDEALQLYTSSLDMVVSVKISPANPYYNLFEENEHGLLQLSKAKEVFTRRQDIPPVYEFNGSLYIINPRSLQNNQSFRTFTSIKKYTMEEKYSIDLDTPDDWEYAEFLMQKAGKHE